MDLFLPADEHVCWRHESNGTVQPHSVVFPQAAFALAGTGRLEQSKRRLARELGISGRAFSLGACTRVPELLAAAGPR